MVDLANTQQLMQADLEEMLSDIEELQESESLLTFTETRFIDKLEHQIETKGYALNW